MKRLLIAVGVLFFLFHTTIARADAGCSPKIRSVNTTIPAPAEGFVEVGNEKRDYFAQRDTRRLLCAFVESSDLPNLWKPARGMNRFMLVATDRRYEDHDITPAEFEQIVTSVKPQLDQVLSQTAKAKEQELRSEAKALHRSEEVSISQPETLGTTFEIKDAYGFGVIVAGLAGGERKKYVNQTVIMRLNKRIVALYINAVYKDESTVKWAGSVAEKWARQILAANPD